MLILRSPVKSSARQMTSVSDDASHAAIKAASAVLPLTVSTVSGPCRAWPERLPAAAAGAPPSAPSPFSADSSRPAVGPVPLSPPAPLASGVFAFRF